MVLGAEAGQRDLIKVTVGNNSDALQRIFKLLEVGRDQLGLHGHGGL